VIRANSIVGHLWGGYCWFDGWVGSIGVGRRYHWMALDRIMPFANEVNPNIGKAVITLDPPVICCLIALVAKIILFRLNHF
jgi:hypothetical protein